MSMTQEQIEQRGEIEREREREIEIQPLYKKFYAGYQA